MSPSIPTEPIPIEVDARRALKRAQATVMVNIKLHVGLRVRIGLLLMALGAHLAGLRFEIEKDGEQ